MDLGRIGVWTSSRALGGDDLGEAARAAEELGFGAFWLGGSPALTDIRPALDATDSIVLATGILNVWQHEPDDLAAEHAALTADFPGRVLLGIGIGHPEATSDYKRPVTTMRRFFDGLDQASTPVPTDERVAAALGPKMLDLAAERSLGTHPYFTSVAHTRAARERLGPDALVAPEVACVLETDPEAARAKARDYAQLYLGLSNYTRNLLDHGFTQQDIENGGSDALIDTVIPHGSTAQVAEAIREHLAAGADHVCVQPVGIQGVPREEWAALAEALLG